MKSRVPIPVELKDRLLVECGYQCSVPNCNVTQSLEFHHIDGDPSNNTKANIIVLCAVHHHQADLSKISKRSLNMMKNLLLDLDGTLQSTGRCERIEVTTEELYDLLQIARQLSAQSLRILAREFIRGLLNMDTGYHCRQGIKYNDSLLEHGLVLRYEEKGPALFRASEKGKLLCRFLFTSQYNLPGACFDSAINMDIERLKSALETKFICFGQNLSQEKDDSKSV
jgi:hypothetical protein